MKRTALVGILLLPLACRDDAAGTSEGGDTEPGSADASATSPTADGTDSEGDTEDPEGDVEIVELTPQQHLTRASMAIRGTRPTLAELAQVEEDPERIGALVDGWLETPEFAATIRALHNEALLAVPDYFYYPAGFQAIDALEGRDRYEINRSVMEAPLRLIEHVVMNDRPYSEIVTADYTVADGVVATVWGLDYAGDGASWEVTSWTDGRQNAGVLSDSWLYQRHQSTDSNANRGRANAIATAFLCSDFLANEVDVDVSIDLSDPNAVSQAVLQNPACAACHAQLDPLASYFRGFNPGYVPELSCIAEGFGCGYPMELPWYEELFPELLGVQMQPAAYYGVEGDGLAFLGQQIANDSRFADCAVRRFWSYLLQTDLDAVPDDIEEELAASFTDGGMNAKALVKEIVLSDAFRMSHVVAADPAAPTEAELEAAQLGVLKARPLALAQMIEDLTGFVWVTNLNGLPDGMGGTIDLGRVPLLEDSFLGYAVLSGGIDSMYVTRPAHTYTGPNFLVLETLAREAAHHVVEADFAKSNASNRKLLRRVEADTRDEAAIRDQIAQLHLRIFGASAEGADVDALYVLWMELLAISDEPPRAWKGVLAAMLQDLRIAYY